ncbi:type VI secretion system protein TssA [Xenorhabdus hominickii]|uniref:ImpA N-terminal domain-containing protein n=1 Tax=Xenorhabdus hominickii TaxID=351679 RepID=A0A2G0Q1Y7_XENHO|nr:type VI secretion system protein TssA [Xenorhabdus hominickii]AOM40266.1 hypothetical protein A9255_06555 [Xenorhabdus hominickii]PHM53221.1 hypothetical protein Xhom_04115 [Xenorhabdus hominickii]
MNIDVLLEPISAELPCGENLEYDAEFIALEYSLLGKAEQQFGDVTIPEEPPDWIQVEKQSITLLSRTKDLRIIIALTQSWLEIQGLCGYADGLDLLKQTLERYWEEVWPTLEFEGEYDPLFRLNVFAAIEDGSPFMLQAQHSTLLKNPSKELSLYEVYSLLDGSINEISGYTGGRTRLLDELKQQASVPEIAALIKIRDSILAILNIIRQKLSAGQVPELSKFLKHLNDVIKFCPSPQPTIDISEESSNQDEPETPPSMVQAKLSSAMTSTNMTFIHWHDVEINNRDEARILLEKAKSYFVQHEPSHPAPMMIDRIQRLIDRDFIDIVYDLAPEGLNRLEVIFGRSGNIDSDSDNFN